MNKFLRFNKNDILSLLISLVIFFIFFFLYKSTTIFDGMENGSINFRFNMRDTSESSKKITAEKGNARKFYLNKKAHKDIYIAGIDEDTLVQFNPMGVTWPFPWKTHATVTNFIAQDKPNSILFDIMFVDHKQGEKEFAAAIRDSNCTFLDYQFVNQEIDTVYPDIDERLKLLEAMRFKVPADDNSPEWKEISITPPNPLLGRASKGVGFADVRLDKDNINRRMPLLVKYQGYYYPNIDLIVLMNYYGIPKENVEISMGKYIKLKNVPVEKMIKPNPERTITIPINNVGEMDINFIGPSGAYSYGSYYYFHNDNLKQASGAFKNKIVLVGIYGVLGVAKDTHKAPGFGEMFGIEHHANALNTILTQDFIYRLSDMQNALIFLVIALLMGYLFSRVSIIGTIVITFVLFIGYAILGQMLFDSRNIIIAFSSPIIMIGSNFAITTAFRLITEQSEKRYIRQTFSKFVSKSVVDELLKHPEKIKLGGDKKILTVLFSDVRGFTSLSEKLTPEQLVEHLNEYLQAMTDIVFKYQGTLDKYVGDELMAFWGAPVPQDDHAILACKAAIEMMSVLRRMNVEWESIGKSPLDIGIGLNSGDMVVGNMGSHLRMDYTLMGDNVNLGARLEGTNKVYGTSIIISEFTYEHVKDKVIVRELDLIRVKGKQLPVKIYELVDVLD
jgi:adenylate cyclase